MIHLALFLLVAAIPAAAQILTGSLAGTVEDPTGAAIQGATLTLVHSGSGQVRHTETDATGGFFFGGLDGGEYTLKISCTGFKASEQRKLMIATGDRLRLPTITLEVGAVSEVVDVTARAPVVQTESGDRSDVITSEQVDNLSLIGRNVMSLARLVPGVIDIAEEDSIGRSTQFNVMGNNKRSNNVSIDGVSATEGDSGMSVKMTVAQDAVAEVRILVSNYQAEFGRAAGSNMVIVTKSGTRRFHGLASYFKRHEQFNAGDFFDNRDRRDKPRYRYNTWTYNVGGPLYIPRVFNTQRSKLFFFFQQELWPSRVGTIGRRTMPNALERDGDFSQTFDTNGRLITVRDPFDNNTPFPGNRIPASRLDPSGRAMLKALDSPNFFDTAVSRYQYNYVYLQEQDRPRGAETLKIDYNINPSNIVTGTFNGYSEKAAGYGVTGITGNWPQMRATYSAPGLGLNTRYTHIFTPALMNELQVSWLHSAESHKYSAEELRRNQRDGIGFAAGQLFPSANPLGIIPNATFGGVTNPPTFTFDGRFPFDFVLHNFSIDDRVTHTRGAHNFKAGVYAERFYRSMRIQGDLFNSQIDFGTNANNPLNTGWAFANAALGVFNQYSEASANPRMHAQRNAVEGFVQDNWKVRRRLTFDVGVRFYWTPPIVDRDNIMSGFVASRFNLAKQPVLIQPGFDSQRRRIGIDPRNNQQYPATAIGAIAPGSGDLYNGMVSTLIDPRYPRGLTGNPGLQLGPRFGFAYDVSGKARTVVRGGFGMFYNREVMANAFKWLIAQPPNAVTPILQYGQLAQLRSYSGLFFPNDVLGRDPAGHTPTVMNYSLSVQRNLGRDTLVDVGYTGALGRHLWWRRNLNPVPIGADFLAGNADPTQSGKPLAPAFLRPMVGYTDVNIIENANTSNYNSLQVTARRRFTRGFQFGLAWTWSKTLTYVDEDQGTNANSNVSTLVDRRVWNYGLASFDRTHVFALNYLYDLPKTRWSFRPARLAVNGWQLSGITRFISGAPMTVGFTTTNAADISGTPSLTPRIVVTGNPVLPKGERTFEQFFRTDVFRVPAAGTIGNAAKYLLRGPGINTWDISLFRNFRVRERFNTQFRCEAYNAFNHTQFSAVNSTARFDATGAQINAAFGQYTDARRPRYIQLALRLSF
jgi:hypothetical protein